MQVSPLDTSVVMRDGHHVPIWSLHNNPSVGIIEAHPHGCKKNAQTLCKEAEEEPYVLSVDEAESSSRTQTIVTPPVPLSNEV